MIHRRNPKMIKQHFGPGGSSSIHFLTSSRKSLRGGDSSNDDDDDDEEERSVDDREPEKATISAAAENQKLLFSALTSQLAGVDKSDGQTSFDFIEEFKHQIMQIQ